MKFAVILSGCGNLDGAEIHESVSTLLAIDRAGATYQCFAPNIEQHDVMDFVNKKPTSEKRNVLHEAARIARGDIKDLNDFNIDDYDALMMPGGFGVAKNLSTYAFEGANFTVNKQLAEVLNNTVKAGKPIGALCIAPLILAKVLNGATVTLGQDEATIDVVKQIGANHVKTNSCEIVVDDKYKLVTAPCYMLNATIKDVANEAQQVVDKIITMLK